MQRSTPSTESRRSFEQKRVHGDHGAVGLREIDTSPLFGRAGHTDRRLPYIWGTVELGSLSDKELTLVRRERIGFVFQAFNLIPTLNATREHPPATVDCRGSRPMPSGTKQVVSAVDLDDRLTHRPSELSGGQQQSALRRHVHLCRKPAIVFADEPSGNLDSKSGNELLQFMRHAVDEFASDHRHGYARCAFRLVFRSGDLP